MTVMIVDDQIHVVSSIFFGLDWRRIHVDKALKAYSAAEARELIRRQPVDILLCDIEMPVESGLDLFRWIKEQKMEIECIFLTAHADFIYAKEAIQLGSFDYLLQPARYEDIESAIVRAQSKIRHKAEFNRYYAYGKALYHTRDKLVDAVFTDWFTGRETDGEELIADLARLGIPVGPDSRLYVVLVQIIRWDDSAEKLDGPLLRYALDNIISELFEEYGQKILLAPTGPDDFVFVTYGGEACVMEEQTAARQLENLIDLCRKYLSCQIACYTGQSVTPMAVAGTFRKLLDAREENVGLSSRVILTDAMRAQAPAHYDPPDMNTWGSMLLDGYADAVYRQASDWLDRMDKSGRLSAAALRRFYQGFTRLITTVAGQTDYAGGSLFSDREILEKAVLSYTSIDNMKAYVRLVTRRCVADNSRSDENPVNQVEQIVQYIRDHIDGDIHRTDIAEAVFLNPSYISRLFKSKMGVSLKEFITREKMKMAQALLRSTSLPVGMVALRVGYTNFSYFSQTYKKICGVTPGEDRKSAR